MNIKTYKSKTNEEYGFSIQEYNKKVSLWMDEYEGGDAHDIDWSYIDEFKTVDEAYSYILENYGEVELIYQSEYIKRSVD